jgi:hypothetical protein
MELETTLPEQGHEAPEAGGQPDTRAAAADTTDQASEREVGEQEGEGKPAKPEKTPEQREIERLRRGIDRRTRQLAELRAERGLTREPMQENNRADAGDSEPLSLTRAELAEMVKAEAQRLAPTLREQAAEVERRQGVIESLAKTWGQERFDALASDLDDAMGGLTDRDGKPKAAIEAVFEADQPARLIEWLADPDNADEAERISRMSAVQAGKAVARLEDRLKSEDAKTKPKASKAPPPLEAVRGQGSDPGAPDPSNTKAWIRWRNEQERKGY